MTGNTVLMPETAPDSRERIIKEFNVNVKKLPSPKLMDGIRQVNTYSERFSAEYPHSKRAQISPPINFLCNPILPSYLLMIYFSMKKMGVASFTHLTIDISLRDTVLLAMKFSRMFQMLTLLSFVVEEVLPIIFTWYFNTIEEFIYITLTGGLLAGLATSLAYLAHHKVRVFGVEPETACGMYKSVKVCYCALLL